MEEAVQEKSHGLKFAEQQLLRHGWEHGKGLGRAGNGISEAIKVKVKCDKGGVGHKEGEQFSFHWWDHVFNKASSSLQVESDQSGIKLKKSAEEDEDGTISNKKPRKASQAKDKLYGCFVKSATLRSGQEQPEPNPSQSDSSSDEDEEEQKLDLSSTTKLSDADLMKVCGGRTAHKGARHGLTMSAKLARLEQQEAEFMAKYGKKSRPDTSSPVCVPAASQFSQSERQEECHRKKKSPKDFQSTEINVPLKKKRGDDEEEEAGEVVCCVENGEEDYSDRTRRKNKKRTKMAAQDEDETPPSPAAEPKSNCKTKKKKKKKSSTREAEPGEEEEGIDEDVGQSDRTLQEEAEVLTSAKKPKRKKSQKDQPQMEKKKKKSQL